MTQSFDDLKKQARDSYRYWHIVLEYHQRKINSRLQISGRLPRQQHQFLDALNLLKETGFPGLPSDLSAIASPPLLTAEPCEQLFFQSLLANDAEDVQLLLCVRILPGGSQETSEIIAVSASHASYIEQSIAHFNRCALEQPADLVYEAAQLWAVLHGDTVLPFQVLTSPFPIPFVESDHIENYVGTNFEDNEPVNLESDAAFQVEPSQIIWGQDW